LKNTKIKFKQELMKAKDSELLKLFKKLKKSKFNGNTARFSGANPYDKGEFPSKIIRYKLNLLKQEMQRRNIIF